VWLLNHHPALPNRPAAAVPSADFVGRGLPESGKLHRFWFGCLLNRALPPPHEGVRNVADSTRSQMSIKMLPGVGNLVG
jgi:hypothetical protein